MTNSIGEIGDAQTILAIGTNTAENHPIIFHQVKRAVENGGKLIVIDPREVALCALAHRWLRLNPGTDVPLLMGMARVIIEEDLFDKDFIAERCEGFDDFKNSLDDFDLDTVSELTGVKPDDIKEAARIFAKETPGTILYAMGITQHSKGTDNVLAIANLAMLTGNIGKPSTGVNPLRGQNNVQGSCDMGGLPMYFTGYQGVDDPVVREKFEKKWDCTLPGKPGLKLSYMFEKVDQGELRAMYVIGENPVLSDPDAQHVEKSLKKLDLLIVQDIFLTETAQLAHVVLPAACSFEKDGTFSNTERRVQRIRQAVSPVGNARADWQILCSLAQAMDEQGFNYQNPAEIMDEIASLTPSYGGINYKRLEQGGLQWPCPDQEHPGTVYLHAQSFPRGKGLFSKLAYKLAAETADEQYPFILSTGRNLYHYHTGSMTRRCDVLKSIQDEEFAEINPIDAKKLDIEDGQLLAIYSRRGEVTAKARITERSPEGVLFMTFHFAESPTNQLTNTAMDPVSGTPELKISAINIQKINQCDP